MMNYTPYKRRKRKRYQKTQKEATKRRIRLTLISKGRILSWTDRSYRSVRNLCITLPRSLPPHVPAPNIPRQTPNIPQASRSPTRHQTSQRAAHLSKSTPLGAPHHSTSAFIPHPSIHYPHMTSHSLPTSSHTHSITRSSTHTAPQTQGNIAHCTKHSQHQGCHLLRRLLLYRALARVRLLFPRHRRPRGV